MDLDEAIREKFRAEYKRELQRLMQEHGMTPEDYEALERSSVHRTIIEMFSD